jgi:hypothetical protein
MEVSSVALLLFTVFSALRIFACRRTFEESRAIPTERRPFRTPNGSLWTGANISTALYAPTNLYLAFVQHAVCRLLRDRDPTDHA